MVTPAAKSDAVAAARDAHGISERRAALAKVPSAKPMESQRRGARSSALIGLRFAIAIGAAMMRRCGPGCAPWRGSGGVLAIGGLACC
jgi:hypothetical protein